MRSYLFISICFCLFISCQKGDGEKTIFSDLEFFSEIEINSSFEVFIKESDSFSIEITGDENIIDDVTFAIENNILTLDNQRSATWITPKKNKIVVIINSQPLDQIKLNKTNKLETLNPITSDSFGLILADKANEANLELDCNSFYYWNNFPCGGKLTLSGRTDELKIWNFALMSVDAKNLTTNYALIENSSKGNCEITVIEKLDYSILGVGDILVHGSPLEINEFENNSTGELIVY